MHAHSIQARRIYGCERGPRERYVYSMHVLEDFITPAEEEQLEPFYKLLESRVGVSEVDNSEI
jgi:succinate dehydrogenase flavin-adding protein (antitoxin of CptAB toxin-antitoxin module)